MKTANGMSWMKRISLLFYALTLLCSATAVAQDGEKLFKQNCTSCHVITDKKVVGPGLAGMFDRVPSEEWAIKWIKNSSAMIAAGDPYGVKIFNEYGKAQMTAFEYLSDDEIKAILAYVKNPPVEAAPVVTTDAPAVGASTESGTMSADTLTYILGAIALLLLLLVTVLSGVKRSLGHLVSAKEGVPAPQEKGALASVGHWVNTHRAWTAFFGLLIILALGRIGIEDLMKIGVYQGYAPEQPINFSHKIHAGQNGINCVYCHTSAEKGKSAGIPSLNVCMNCPLVR
jgi:mono/diheme cytochrome c family protein